MMDFDNVSYMSFASSKNKSSVYVQDLKKATKKKVHIIH